MRPTAETRAEPRRPAGRTLAPRYLGLRLVIAKGFARIHEQNLANFGVLALTFADPGDYGAVEAGDVLVATDLRATLRPGEGLTLRVDGADGPGRELRVEHSLSPRQVEVVLAGGLTSWIRERR